VTIADLPPKGPIADTLTFGLPCLTRVTETCRDLRVHIWVTRTGGL